MSRIPCPSLPPETAQAARSLFGLDHAYIQAGEALSSMWDEIDLTAVEAGDVFLASSFYPLSLATVFQFWEHLTDRQMAQASRTRLDLKYAMHLPLRHPGFEASMLCMFRQHILGVRAAANVLQSLIDHLAPFASREKHDAKVDQVITSICIPSRAEVLLECMEIALEGIATQHPQWLKVHAPAHWYSRYHGRPNHQKLPRHSREVGKLMLAVGEDAWHLLEVIDQSQDSTLAQLPEIVSLRRECRHQFERPGGALKLRAACEPACQSDSAVLRSLRVAGKEDSIGPYSC